MQNVKSVHMLLRCPNLMRYRSLSCHNHMQKMYNYRKQLLQFYGRRGATSKPVCGWQDFCFTRPQSTTYRMPDTVMEVSAMFVARITSARGLEGRSPWLVKVVST